MAETNEATRPRDAAGAVTNEAAERAAELKDTASEHVGAVASEAKEKARNVMDQTRSEVGHQLDEQGRRAGKVVRHASEQLHSMAESAEPGVVTDLTRQLGDGLENVARTVEQGGVQGVADDLRRFARRQPGLFLVGAGVAGFVVTRLLRSGAMSAASGNGSSSGQTPTPASSTTGDWPGEIGTEPSIAPTPPVGLGAGGALGGTVTP
jgi:hypothetical protein